MESKKFEVSGMKGMQNKPFKKVFKSQEQFEAWLEKQEGNVEIIGFRDVE